MAVEDNLCSVRQKDVLAKLHIGTVQISSQSGEKASVSKILRFVRSNTHLIQLIIQ